MMHFKILGAIFEVETFAAGSSIRQLARLRKIYGRGRWRKRKGIARIRLADGSIHLAELHWYEAAGIGRKELKIKHLRRFPLPEHVTSPRACERLNRLGRQRASPANTPTDSRDPTPACRKLDRAIDDLVPRLLRVSALLPDLP